MIEPKTLLNSFQAFSSESARFTCYSLFKLMSGYSSLIYRICITVDCIRIDLHKKFHSEGVNSLVKRG